LNGVSVYYTEDGWLHMKGRRAEEARSESIGENEEMSTRRRRLGRTEFNGLRLRTRILESPFSGAIRVLCILVDLLIPCVESPHHLLAVTLIVGHDCRAFDVLLIFCGSVRHWNWTAESGEPALWKNDKNLSSSLPGGM
jgi:hypothetical protein